MSGRTRRSKGKDPKKAEISAEGTAAEEPVPQSSGESDGGEESQGGDAAALESHQSEEDGRLSDGGEADQAPSEPERREGNATLATLLTQLPAAISRQQQERQSLGTEGPLAANSSLVQRTGNSDKAPAAAFVSGSSTSAGAQGGRIVQMSDAQYQAFLQFAKQNQTIVPSRSTQFTQAVASGGAAIRATPSASSATPSAFKVNPPNQNEEEIVWLDSDGEQQHASLPQKKQKPKSSSSSSSGDGQRKVTITSPKKGGTAKAPAKVAKIRCPNCGNEDASHVHITCREDRRTDLVPSRSSAELNFLKQLDILRRAERVKDKSMRQQGIEEESSGDSIRSEVPSEEEEAEDEDDGMLDDESSYVPSSQSRSVSQSSAGAASSSASSSRLGRLENAVQMLIQAVIPRTQQVEQASLPRLGSNSNSLGGQAGGEPWLSLSAARNLDASGMVGVPVLKASDMLNLTKFEELERKYADYCDKSITINRRTPQPIAKCFDKLLSVLVVSMNSLLDRNSVVRKKFKDLLHEHNYQVSDAILMGMNAKDFSKLYRELITSRTSLASELLSSLIDTPFQRTAPEGEDPFTLTALVIQAMAAFSEKLERCPSDTVSRCTPVQIRDAFVKMILGKEEHHLADFLSCANYQEAARHMLDLDGTGQGISFMKNAQRSGKFKHTGGSAVQSDKEAHRPQPGSSKSDSADWKRLFEDLAPSVEHNASEMQGHESTWKSKYQRLLQIRDGRLREAHMRQIEKGNHKSTDQGGGAAAPYKSRSPPREQRERQDYRDRSRDGSGHRDRQRDGGYDTRRDGNYRRGGGGSQDRPYGFGDERGERYQQRETQHGRSGGNQERAYSSQERERHEVRDQSPHSHSGRAQRSPSAERRVPENESRQRDQKQAQPSSSSTSHSRTQLGAGNAASTRCYNCDGTGHLARDCTHPARGGGTQRRHSASPSSRQREE